jgi:5-(carboxyamino)imidazole ribonucleotide synthase
MKVGIAGAGQLGRMLGLAAIPLGIECEFLDSAADSPAARLGRIHLGSLDDVDALASFGAAVDVLTPEIENVAFDGLLAAASRCAVHPNPMAVAAAQDRLSEKKLFAALGIPTAPYICIDGQGDLACVPDALDWPIVIKSRRLGYDGRGQRVAGSRRQLESAWMELGQVPALAEGWVDFRREVSLIAVRGMGNAQAFYPLSENVHADGLLRSTIAPCRDAALQSQAEQWLGAIMEHFDYVGALSVEFFDTAGELIANEMAPRVHNSGHWTIEGAVTSQFENHLRAITGMPLGDPSARGHAAMLNFIGQMPAAETVLGLAGAHLHDYGKRPRPGRKVGHCTLVDTSRKRLMTRLGELEGVLCTQNS